MSERTGGSELRAESGLTLIEVLVALAIAVVLIGGLAGVVGRALDTWVVARREHALTREARFAVDRMQSALGSSSRLLVPRADDVGTAWSESVRDVLVVTLDPRLDTDGDGVVDADNDRDGRVDEDWGADSNDDGAPGVAGIDDDGDSVVDEGAPGDDDEDGTANEDPLNGGDDDGDGSVGEDPPADMNADGQPGEAGADDDGDTFIDEGLPGDDDEDGSSDEDWIDTVAYFLAGTTLVERIPDPDPSAGGDFSESPIAESVSLFRVERLPPAADARATLVEIRLELSAPGGASVSLTSRARVGGAR